MNKLIEKSYVLSLALSIACVVLFFLFAFADGFSDPDMPKATFLFNYVLYPLMILTVISYLTALIKALKTSSIVFTIIYAFLLMCAGAYGYILIFG